MSSPPRKRGSSSIHTGLDSRFRGNDWHGVIFERAEGGISLREQRTCEIRRLARNGRLCGFFSTLLQIRFPRSALSDLKERQVGLTLCFSQKQQRQFPRMIVSPHGRLPAGYLSAGWNVVPAFWAMVYGVEDQPLVLRMSRKVGLIKQCIRDGDGCLSITSPALGIFGPPLQISPQSPESLPGDCRR